ncbi:hypothetical protein DF150_24140 [Burkholderia cenocepacia]|nr:hypothetical protein DF150_24140 [Burkholderia cenocepacia]
MAARPAAMRPTKRGAAIRGAANRGAAICGASIRGVRTDQPLRPRRFVPGIHNNRTGVQRI